MGGSFAFQHFQYEWCGLWTDVEFVTRQRIAQVAIEPEKVSLFKQLHVLLEKSNENFAVHVLHQDCASHL